MSAACNKAPIGDLHDIARRLRLPAFIVPDDRNDGPGGYRAGQLVYVDLAIEPMVGRDVVVTLASGHLLGRLQEDAEGCYLLALNPAAAERVTRLPAGVQCRGVVVGVFTPDDVRQAWGEAAEVAP